MSRAELGEICLRLRLETRNSLTLHNEESEKAFPRIRAKKRDTLPEIEVVRNLRRVVQFQKKGSLLRLWCVKSKAKQLTRPKPKLKIGRGAPIANRKMELPCSLYLILWRSLRDLCEIQPPTNDPCIVLETPNVRCSPIVSNKTCRETRRCELGIQAAPSEANTCQ